MSDLKDRTKKFALRVIRLVDALPKDRVADVLGRQLLRSGTSVGANFRSASRAKSNADFIAKLKIVEEECDESMFWIELIVESGRIPEQRVGDLLGEADQIVAMVVASIKKSRRQEKVRQRKGVVIRPS